MTPIIISSFAIIAFAALIHASFQLSVSVLTLLSGHSLGRKTAHTRVLGLMSSFIIGVAIGTGLLLSAVSYYFVSIIQHSASTEQFFAAMACGLLAGLGIATWAFYYRKGEGTSLWLPRSLARYLAKRAKATKSSPEAFSLGLTSVITELVFIIGPIAAAALAIVTLPNLWWQLAGVGLYVIISLGSLLAVFVAVGGGHKMSKIQTWRENNKRFLQFVGGGSLIILAAFLYIDRLLGISLYGAF